MVDVYERALMIRARIAALRHYLLQNTTNHAVVENNINIPLPFIKSKPIVEPDWGAINKLKAKNDALEAKANEMGALKAKLLGKK